MKKNKTSKSLVWVARNKKKEVESCEQLEHENDDRTQNVNKKLELWKNSNYINTTPVSYNSE